MERLPLPPSSAKSLTFNTWTPIQAHLSTERAWIDERGIIQVQAKLKAIEDKEGHFHKEFETKSLYAYLPKNTTWEEAWDPSLEWSGQFKISALGRLRFKPRYAFGSEHARKPPIFKSYASLIHSTWKRHVIRISQNQAGPIHGSHLLSSMLGAGYCGVHVDFLLTRFGLKHLTAISGLHFSIVMATLLILLWKTPIQIRLMAAVLGTTLFLLATGLSGSSTRAWLMSLITCYCLWKGKKYDALRALGVSALFWAAFFPSWTLQPGFVLSYLCTLLLILMAQLENLSPIKKKPLRSLVLSAISWQTGIFLGTAPFVLYWFHSLSWLSLPANMLVAPLLALAFILALLACFFFWLPPLSALLWLIASHLCNSLLELLDNISLGWDMTLYYTLSSFEFTLLATLIASVCLTFVKELFPSLSENSTAS